jgi:hypothetical protein
MGCTGGRRFVLAWLLALAATPAIAVTINITTNRTWSSITTGSGVGGQPNNSDTIVVNNATLTVDVPTGQVGAMTLGGGGGPGTLAFAAGGAGQATIAANLTLGSGGSAGNLTMANGGTLRLAGFTSSTVGTFTRGTGTVVLTGTNTLPAAAAYNTFNNLSVTGNTTTLGQNLTVAGNLNISAGTLNTSTRTLAVTGSAIVGGTLTLTNTTTISGTTSIGGTLSITSATGNKTFAGNVTVAGTWNTTVAGNIFLQGNLTNNGTFTAGAATYTFNGAAAQTLSGASAVTSMATLTLNNAAGLSLTGAHNFTITTLLTLTAGKIATGSNVVYISNGSAIASAATGRFIEGNLRKPFSGAALTRVFEVGGNTGTNYDPVSITFASISAAGDITVTTTAGSHPQLNASGLDTTTPAKLNRWWTITNSTVAFTTYAATFTFVNAEADDPIPPAPSDTSPYLVMNYSNAAWSSTALSGAPTATTIGVTAETDFGDFAAGEPAQYNINAGTAGRFNAYDSPPTTPAGSVQGFIRTKTAGSSFALTIVHLTTAGTALIANATFNGKVELLDASPAGGTFTNNCSSNWTTVIFDSGAVTNLFNAANTISYMFNPAAVVPTNLLNNSWPNVRVRVTRTAGGTEIGCSGDRFAIRPADLVMQAYDTTWQTAGTDPLKDRVLNNVAASGGVVHAASTAKASPGRPFTLRATARNAAGTPATTTNYAGSPTAKAGSPACVLPASCAAGTLDIASWSASSGVVTADAHYSEAGTFNLELEDLSFANVDLVDTALSVRRIPQAAPAPRVIGRFVPDRFGFTSANAPQLQTFGASCASARSFTYLGQPFWYATAMAPTATVQALNAAAAVTTNYRGTLFKLTASDITETYSNNAVGPTVNCKLTSDLTTACSPTNAAAPSLKPGSTAPTFGTGAYGAASSGAALIYARSATHPPSVSPYNAKISLSVAATDGNETGTGNPGVSGLTTPAPLIFNGLASNGIAFDGTGDFNTGAALTSGGTFVYGLARLDYVTGPENVDHPVLLQTQYWDGTAFVRNTQDNCTSFVPKNFVLAGHQGSLTTTNMVSPVPADPLGPVAGNVSISGTLTSGFANLKVLKPTGIAITAPGSVRICLDLDSAAGGDTSCQAPTPAGRSYLQGRWTLGSYDKDPFNGIGFGIYGAQPRNFIYFRENY